MAVCAGCLKEVDGVALAERGIVSKSRYCEACLPTVDEFLRERDKLHTELAKRWQEGLWALVGDYSSRVKGLPDV